MDPWTLLVLGFKRLQRMAHEIVFPHSNTSNSHNKMQTTIRSSQSSIDEHEMKKILQVSLLVVRC